MLARLEASMRWVLLVEEAKDMTVTDVTLVTSSGASIGMRANVLFACLTRRVLITELV